MEIIKRCSKCKIEKYLSEFYKGRSECKACKRIYDKNRWEKISKDPFLKKKGEDYRKKNRSHLNKIKKELYYSKYRKLKEYKKNCIYCKKLFITSFPQQIICGDNECLNKLKRKNLKEFYLKNKDKIMESNRIRHHIYKKNPLYILKRRCRTRLTDFIRYSGYKKVSKTEEMIGCSWEELKIHIEKQFKVDMSWENREKWHIDHKIPLFLAKNGEQVKLLFHYKNLQPLWSSDNLKKGKKLNLKISK